MSRRNCLAVYVALACLVAGCHDPEDGRPRGGGSGGDARNYRPGAVRPPSKIEGTKNLDLLQHDAPRTNDSSINGVQAGSKSSF